MLGRTLLAALLVAGSIMTGCLGGEEPPAAPAAADNETEETVLAANESTEAPDGRGEISAFKETNRTEAGVGSMEHTHDAWGGAERLENVAYIRGGLIPIPFLPCKESGACTVGGSAETYPAGTAIADFDLAPPPDMGMIYEGTGKVELVLTEFEGIVGPANPLGKVYFDYLAANDEPGAMRTGGELKLNEPFVIDIKPTDADMPHQTKSLWVFRIYSNSEMVEFVFNITINLIKGYDVVNWPPHPDLYANNPTRTIFDGSVSLESKGTIDALAYGSDAGWTNPERVISWGTQRVSVTVSNVAFTSTVPGATPTGFVLEYHNASKPPLLGNGEQFGDRLTDPSSDGTTFHFTIDLTNDRGDAMDTPYAQYSRWGFRLVPFFEDLSGQCVDEMFFPGLLSGCQWYPWQMTYDLKIEATGVSHSV